MASACRLNLTPGDAAVLHALFDPESALSAGVRIDHSLDKSHFLSPNEREERAAISLINQESPTTSNIELAISKLSQVVKSDPRHASAWNNRAQASRMLFKDDNIFDNPVEIQGILSDLSVAISLATPRSPTDAISARNASVLASAHTHRGYLLWMASRRPDAVASFDLVEDFKGLNREELEEKASSEFFLGGRYGNQIAQQLAIRTNPYAKLCGNIVKEAMRKEILDHYTMEETSIK